MGSRTDWQAAVDGICDDQTSGTAPAVVRGDDSPPPRRPARRPGHHACDDLGQPRWSTLASHEIVDVKDGAPYRVGADWYVERTSTILPLCNYINAVGNYSLRSSSLSPEEKIERVMI